MSIRFRPLAVLGVLALGSAAVSAQDQPAPQGDPERGRVLGYTCLGCHGIPNYKNAYPVYSVPKLTGQHPQYIVAALKGYRSGERGHATMHSQAMTLSEQDMWDIAAFMAGEPLGADAKPVDSAPQKVNELCASCHGANGVGIVPDYPTLAGQHEDYLVRSLIEYQKGARKNPIMMAPAAGLTAAEIREIARYYAQQRPALEVLDKSRTRLSARN
jgi:cytochrome c553